MALCGWKVGSSGAGLLPVLTRCAISDGWWCRFRYLRLVTRSAQRMVLLSSLGLEQWGNSGCYLMDMLEFEKVASSNYNDLYADSMYCKLATIAH